MAESLFPAEENNSRSWYTAGLAGIVSGAIKVPEGVFSLGAELIDLGFDTNTAADVEQFFDTLNPFEEIAAERGIGKLTEALVSIGVPGTQGFKLGSSLANKYFRAKKAGKSISSGSKNLVRSKQEADRLNETLGYKRFAAGAIGGAAGEAFVADVEEIGSFGDLFDRGPTQLDTFSLEGGREDATRKLMNRIKFGSEALFVTPFVAGAGKGAKALATKGKDLAYSNSRVERWLGKVADAFTPEGGLSKAVFGSQRVMEGFRGADLNRATELVKDLDRSVSRAFPQMQKVLDRSLNVKEKEQFYNEINELILDGDISKLSDPKKVDKFVESLRKKGVDEETASNIVKTIDDSRTAFANLLETTGNLNAPELKDILKERIKSTVKNTYKIFEINPVLGVFGRYRPTDESMENAINFFRKQIADNNKDVPYDQNSLQYYEDAKFIVDKILDDGIKAKKRTRGLPDINYLNKTLDDQPGGAFVKDIIEKTGAPPPVIKKLLGEMSDPRYSIFNAITELSGMARTSAMFKEMFETNEAAQKLGQRGSFWKSADEAKKATNQQADIVRVGDELGGMTQFKAGNIENPLEPLYTTRDIADALKRANGLTEGYFTAAVKGKEGATIAEKGASFLYRNLVLFPKATAQLAKTVLSIPTHLRNLISAGAFAGANGILFEGLLDPKLLGNSFRKGWNISGVGNLKATRFDDPTFEKAYRELLELGIVNSQTQIGDLKNLLRDVNFGDKLTDLDSMLSPMMSKLKKIPEYLQGKYVAEDDFWKITNYFVELERRNNAYKKAGITKSVDELKQEAASIVRNTVPNYSYVGDFVRTARLLPVGNFMSFPSEMIRTTVNIGEQAVREMKHSKATIGSNVTPYVLEKETGLMVKNDNPMYRIGATRAAGMAFTLGAVPTMFVEGAKALYDVTEDEIKALRQFVPDWSKNSTLIPSRNSDTGELEYMDFSHSNAYDLMSRPFRTLSNEIISGVNDGDTILKGFIRGAEEAVSEIASPFIDESIWTEAAADISLYPLLPGRGGRTRDGRVLYTDQTPLGDRMYIKMRHLLKAIDPSLQKYGRVLQAATKTPTKTGEQLELSNELAGLAGFRSTKVNPLKSMGFKIAEYQRGIRESRREFTGGYFGLLRGGPIDANDVITRFYESNKARFNVQKEMHKNINAAQILGESSPRLRREFRDRQLSSKTFTNLERGRFESYFPSDDIRERFSEIARDLGTFDVFKQVLPTLRAMTRDMNRLQLSGVFEKNIEPQEFSEGGLVYTPTLAETYGGGIDLNDYLIDTNPLGPAALPQQPMPNPQVVQPQPMAQAPGIMNQGLTATENALLSEEEKQIRLRQRGLA
tara:strand:+ start:2668 stop:6690 length:4023 start_codon:yes stop_codon:yes gene_type:complete